ncbi:MAG TPA: DUF4440 domain-containing protein [Thermoanaerobaculia bacterium]|nr:DUF4440 domain-containing protein [Thermoanaerobaculia bacterium]
MNQEWKRIGVLLLLSSLLCGAAAMSVQASDEDDVRAARTAIVEAAKAKDRAALEPWLASDFTFIHGRGNVLDRAQYLAEATARGPQPAIESSDEKLTIYGGHTAVLVSRGNIRTTDTETNVRSTQIFVKSDDKHDSRWQWVFGQQTLLPVRPKAAAIDPKTLEAYAGTYRLKAGRLIVVFRRGDSLFVEISGRKPGELIPREGDEFLWFNPDVNAEAVFVFHRDANGKIKDVAFLQDGREGWRAQRID